MEEVAFGRTGMAWNVAFGFGLPGMAWNGGSRFWPAWNGLEWRKSLLAGLERLGMEKIGFGPTGVANSIVCALELPTLQLSVQQCSANCSYHQLQLVFDSATGLVGLATKLSVLSRSRLSFTPPAKPSKPAKLFCYLLTVHKTFQKGRNIQMQIFFPPKNVYQEVDSVLYVRCSSQYDTLCIGSV
jgi:hypothetical protein